MSDRQRLLKRSVWFFRLSTNLQDINSNQRTFAGCHAWGQTSEEVQSELVHVFEMIWDEYQEAGQELPEDVEVAVALH